MYWDSPLLQATALVLPMSYNQKGHMNQEFNYVLSVPEIIYSGALPENIQWCSGK